MAPMSDTGRPIYQSNKTIFGTTFFGFYKKKKFLDE